MSPTTLRFVLVVTLMTVTSEIGNYAVASSIGRGHQQRKRPAEEEAAVSDGRAQDNANNAMNRDALWSSSTAILSSAFIRTDVNHRFATTTVTHRLLSPLSSGNTTAVFEYLVPKTAFVVNFTAVVDGRFFRIDSSESTGSRKQQTASSTGKTGVDPQPRGISPDQLHQLLSRSADRLPFRVGLPMSAGGRAEFNLTYQELLVRRLGTYELLHVLPTSDNNGGRSSGVTGQLQQQPNLVPEMRVDIRIKESNEITTLHVVPPHSTGGSTLGNSSEDNPQLRSRRVSANVFHVTYTPSASEQTRWSSSKASHAGYVLLTTRYDVRHQLDAGEIQIKDGYLIHQFSPSGLLPIDKNVVFVLDSSSSMSGTKLTRVIEAMVDILDELHTTDSFNVVLFGADIRYFNNESCVMATSTNIGLAKSFVASMRAAGGANMNDALLRAIEFLVRQEELDPLATLISMVMLVTDGQPTRGITEHARILANVRQASGSRVCIFPVGLGVDVDLRFLDQLAQQNHGGSATRILLSSSTTTTTRGNGNDAGTIVVSDIDSSLAAELRYFYRQMAAPLLKNVRVRYDDVIDEETLTDIDFPAYFEGSEIVVAGKLKNSGTVKPSTAASGGQYVAVKVSGGSTRGYMSLDSRVKTPRPTASHETAAGALGGGRTANSVSERVWSFLTVRRLVRKATSLVNVTIREASMETALRAAHQYSFITPYSPAIVREVNQPNGGPTHGVFYVDLDAQSAEMLGRRRTVPTPTSSVRQRKRPLLGNRRKQQHSFVENDPHFLVSVDGLAEAVCFDVTGVPGNVYQLIRDKRTDIVVNALFVTKATKPNAVSPLPSPINHKPQTYIGTIAVLHGPCSVLVSPQSVQLDNVIYHWSPHGETRSIQCGQLLHVEIVGRRHVTVTVQHDVILRILRHGVSGSHPFKVDFLGFYVENGAGLSEFTHGLIGQFTHQKAKKVLSSLEMLTNDEDDDVRLVTRLSFSGLHSSHRTVRASMTSRRDMEHNAGVACWHVANQGAGLIRGTPERYVVDELTDKRSSFRRILKR